MVLEGKDREKLVPQHLSQTLLHLALPNGLLSIGTTAAPSFSYLAWLGFKLFLVY
jgi:hypothetical protein